MVLLAHEVGVALLQHARRALVEIWVEKPDVGSPDAHVVGEAQALLVVDAVADTCRRHEVVEVLAEVLPVAQYVFHILLGVFVAQSGASGELA